MVEDMLLCFKMGIFLLFGTVIANATYYAKVLRYFFYDLIFKNPQFLCHFSNVKQFLDIL